MCLKDATKQEFSSIFRFLLHDPKAGRPEIQDYNQPNQNHNQPKPPPTLSSNKRHTPLIQKKHLSGKRGGGGVEGKRHRKVFESVWPVSTFQGNKSGSEATALATVGQKETRLSDTLFRWPFSSPFHSVNVNVEARLRNI